MFRAAGFPTVDAPAISPAALDQALAGSGATAYGSAQALADALRAGQADVLLLPYGSAFPVEAWPAIREFVEGGGGLVVLGGAPFAQPVRAQDGAFVPGTRQPTYAHDLLIGPADVVAKGGHRRAGRRSRRSRAAAGRARCRSRRQTFALTVRLATRKDMPAEHGSEGPRDAVVRPLVHVVDRDGIPRACPLLVSIACAGAPPAAAGCSPRRMRPSTRRPSGTSLALAAAGAAQVEARPVRASVGGGGDARRCAWWPPGRGRVTARRARTTRAHEGHVGRRRAVHEGDVALAGTGEIRAGLARCPRRRGPGSTTSRSTVPGAPWPNAVTTGFWVKDDALLAAGPRLSRLARLAARGRQRLPHRRHDVHGVRRAPQVPVRAEPARVGPRLRPDARERHQPGAHRPLDRVVARHARPGRARRERAGGARRVRADGRAPPDRRLLHVLRLPAAGLRRVEPVPRRAVARGPARVPDARGQPLPRRALGALGPHQRAVVLAARTSSGRTGRCATRTSARRGARSCGGATATTPRPCATRTG